MEVLSALFGSLGNLDIKLDVGPNQKTGVVRIGEVTERLPIFTDGDSVSGIATISLHPYKKIEHQGIRAEILGTIEVSSEKGSPHQFFTMSKDLDPAGSLVESRQFKWRFNSVDMPHESYYGTNVRLRYCVRLVILRPYGGSLSATTDFLVQNVGIPPAVNDPIKMEVGIEDALHIEFEYDKSRYHLKDVLIGKVNFLVVRLRIKYMELDLLRTEILGNGLNAPSESETILKFEIMDGNPVKAEWIPVRLYFSGSDISPTFRQVQNKFSVKYHVNLVLVDEDDRRYFKKQEISFWRHKIGSD